MLTPPSFAVAVAAVAQAQVVPQAPEILVTGKRPPDTDAPLSTISREEIDSFAAETAGDVIAAAKRRTPGNDAPVIVNGRRLGDIADISALPPEAIERVEILPPSAGVRQGLGGGTPVVNVVLKKRFRSLQATGEANLPSEGGAGYGRAELGATAIRGERRSNGALSASAQAPLRYSDRFDAELLRQQGGAAEPQASLRASSKALALLAGRALPLGRSQLSLSANGNWSRSERILTGGGGALRADGAGLGGAATFSGLAGHHFWSLVLNARASQSSTETQRGDARLSNRSTSASAGINATASGPLLHLPAGSLQYNVSASFSGNSLSQSSTLGGAMANVRRSANAQFGVTVPILRRGPEGRGLGDLYTRLQAQFDRNTGSTALLGYEQAIGWSPLNGLNLEWTRARQGLGAYQQWAPLTVQPDVLLFDPVTQQSVQVVQILGGNPDLRAPRQSRSSLRLNLSRRMQDTDMSVSAYYSEDRTENPILTPTPSLVFEGAFPDRFTRVGGQLTRVDARPLNAFRQSRQSLNLSTSVSGALGHAREGEASGHASRARWTLTVNYTRRLRESLMLTPVGPVLDLASSQIAAGGGGGSRDSVNGQAGIGNARFGTQLRVDWNAPSVVLGQGSGSNGRYHQPIRLSVDANLNVAANGPGEAGRLRLHLTVENVLGRRPSITFPDRATPFALLPASLDPIGRTIRLSVRTKLG
ncbi:hypothetical protein [Sphingomonas sp. TDK1]|uniref:hypothetical protein n=1 Tax=Sphingomonas sp. TDK1 TaxID=453247 RepID=UPI0007D97A01|nr:hypothetical protein [Sphingomonas sp. TDK1]OAN64022.1 hypothetical protein A7X12_18035 [Sphingomonas sp. TDK1]